jgi:hypothetical protein
MMEQIRKGELPNSSKTKKERNKLYDRIEMLPCSYTNPSKLEQPGPPLSHKTNGSFDGFPSDSIK